jgi:hypothetical protein
MLGQPVRDRRALVAGQVIGDQVERATGIGRGNGVEESPIASAVSGVPGQVSACPSRGRSAP